MNFFSLLFNSFFFIGFIPVASGTFASFFCLLPLFINEFNNIIILAVFSIVFFAISLFTGKTILQKYGDDPSVFVMDEVIGMWVTIIIIKIFYQQTILSHIIIGFFLFRFFDIVKIQPAKYFDKVNNTFGVIMDDVISGIYAGLLSSLFIYLIKFIN